MERTPTRISLPHVCFTRLFLCTPRFCPTGCSVVLSDTSEVIPLLELNASANLAQISDAGGHATVATLNWADWDAEANRTDSNEPTAAPDPQMAPEMAQCIDQCEIILGADLCYQPAGGQLDELMPLLHALLAPTGGRKRRRLLLAHKARHAALDAALIRRLGEIRGVSVREISSEAHHPEYRSAKIKIFDVGGVERAEAVLGLHDTNS